MIICGLVVRMSDFRTEDFEFNPFPGYVLRTTGQGRLLGGKNNAGQK